MFINLENSRNSVPGPGRYYCILQKFIDRTIQLANAASDINIYWFEEPLHHLDFDGYKVLKNQTGISWPWVSVNMIRCR